jgi:hypothetical protein
MKQGNAASNNWILCIFHPWKRNADSKWLISLDGLKPIKFRVRNYRVESASQSSVTEQRPESTSKGSDQRRRISVKDDPGSTSWINGQDCRDGRGSPQGCHLYRPDPTRTRLNPWARKPTAKCLEGTPNKQHDQSLPNMNGVINEHPNM